MYGLDDSLTGTYDAKKTKSFKGTSRFPKKVEGRFLCTLDSTMFKENDLYGKYLELSITVLSSTTPLVVEGKEYKRSLDVGGTKVKNQVFWRKARQLLEVVSPAEAGGEDEYNAPEALRPLLASSHYEPEKGQEKPAPLCLPFVMIAKLQEARPDKETGKYDPKLIDEDGKPKKFQVFDYEMPSIEDMKLLGLED